MTVYRVGWQLGVWSVEITLRVYVYTRCISQSVASRECRDLIDLILTKTFKVICVFRSFF